MNEKPQQITPDFQERQLRLAHEAAVAGNPKEMLSALWSAGILGGLMGRLRIRWKGLQPSDIEDAIADSLVAVYERVSSGKRVEHIVSLLLKICDCRLSDRHRLLCKEIPHGPDTLADCAGGIAKEAQEDDGSPEREQELPYEAVRAQAIAHAKRLLPRLGQDSIQKVMGFIFDAVEAGCDDISNTEIAEAVGLSLDTVRKSKERGWQRLEREARKEGLMPEGFEELGEVLSAEADDPLEEELEDQK